MYEQYTYYSLMLAKKKKKVQKTFIEKIAFQVFKCIELLTPFWLMYWRTYLL